MFGTNQNDNEESISSSDDSSMGEQENIRTPKNVKGMEIFANIECETDCSSSTYSEEDRHVRTNRKRTDVNKAENSDEDDSSEQSIRQLERKSLHAKNEKG